ncbi:MAG TPA: YihY/virulence factor BrkB family protein [Marmoricola sp.]|nr:YihY/virulence factor BrkB family protein [Marmoricola sp.]
MDPYPVAEADEPDELSDIRKRSWFYILRRTVSGFRADQCTDLAAGLTYYAVLALFPGLLGVVSILGVIGANNDKVRNTILEVLSPLVTSSTLDTVRTLLDQLGSSQAGGYALVLGVAGALWSASGYVGAFSRAMNRVYGVPEGRPFWKLKPLQLLITLVTVVLCSVGIVILLVSGPVAESVGNALTIGDTAVTAWNIAKWPVLAVVVCLAVAMLYYMTPNVRQPRFRWISPGAFVAILVWVAASVGFAFYVGNFSSYDRTYGSLAAVIIGLLWLWLTNVALMFGAELDAELERGRELQAGLPAEENLQLPLRDDRGVAKAEEKRREQVADGRALREPAARSDGEG